MVDQITSHVADAQGRVLEQLRFRPVFTGLLDCLVGAVQTLENIAFPVLQGRTLASAVGAQLDGIGSLVGLTRNGLPDATYKLLLLGTIARNNSRTDTETLRTIALAVFGATACLVNAADSPGHAHMRAPATVSLELQTPSVDPSLYPAAMNILTGSIAAGVALSYVATYPADSFALAGSPTGMGLGDANVPGSGGALASLVYTSTVA